MLDAPFRLDLLGRVDLRRPDGARVQSILLTEGPDGVGVAPELVVNVVRFRQAITASSGAPRS
jgi:hypothetical protein